jgi:hypothetical protein
MHTSCRSVFATLLLSSIALGTAGCAVKRVSGPGPSIATYDYAVISQQGSREYYERARTTLDQVFVVVDEGDPRLELPSVRQKACTVTVDWSPGFWSTSGWVELKDYAHGTHVHTSHMRRGMVWVGADADVLEAMRDVAMARAAGPAIPPEARNPAPATHEGARNPSRSTAQRLEELNNLRARGLISESEYSAQRKAIIQEH